LDRKTFRAIATLAGIICASPKRPLARDGDRSAKKPTASACIGGRAVGRNVIVVTRLDDQDIVRVELQPHRS
jgi:hypothetical protein